MSMFKEEETFGQLLQPDQSVKEEHRRDATVGGIDLNSPTEEDKFILACGDVFEC